MVARAGLPLQDMEFVQFHPSGIYGAGVGLLGFSLISYMANAAFRFSSPKEPEERVATF